MTRTLTCSRCQSDVPLPEAVVLGPLDYPHRVVCPDCQTVGDRFAD